MNTVVANGVTHHVQRLPARGHTGAGQAPIVVLVHGILIDSLASYYFTFGPALAQAGFDVIMYDLRGHGRSTRPSAGYRLADFLDDLDALLDVLEVHSPVHLVGNSFGGTIAFGYAERRPERAASVAFIDSTPATPAWATQLAEALTDAKDRLSRPEVIARITEEHGAFIARIAQGAARILGSSSIAEDLPGSELLSDARIAAVAVPIMAIYGDESEMVSRDNRLELVLPSCTTVVVPEQGHLMLIDRPDSTRELILNWLRERSGLGRSLIETSST